VHIVSVASHGTGAQKLAHSPSGTTEASAMTGAVSAATQGSPVAALAALLRAHKLAPNDPVPLVDTAALLAQMGKPNEALGVLRGVSVKRLPSHAPFTVPWSAVMAAARGAAQLGLGHYDAAIAAYTKARRGSKLLPEADQGRAAAYACKDDDQHAMVFLTAGTTRQQFPDGDFVGGDPGTGGRQVTGPEVLDTHHGKTLTLPTLVIPKSVAEGASLDRPYYDYELDLGNQMTAAYNAREQARQRFDAFLTAPTTTPATARRAKDIALAVSLAFQDASIQSLQDKTAADDHAIDKVMTDSAGCLDKGASQTLFRQDTVTYDTDRRNEAAALYRLETALAANMKTPAAHDFAMATARMDALAQLAALVAGDRRIDEYDHNCHESTTSETPVSGDLKRPASASCPSGIEGMSIKLKLFGITVSVNCEVVSASVSTKGWIGAFVSGSYDFGKRQLTIFGGPQVSVSTPDSPMKFGGSVKDGIYVTIGDQGIVDVGARYEHSVTSSVGPVSSKLAGDKMDFSFVGAFTGAYGQ
jgi:hypothetical protein